MGFAMDFSSVLDELQWTLGSKFNDLLQDPSPLQEVDLDFLDLDPPVDLAPTGMHDIQVPPECDYLDLDSLVASVASSSNSPQPSEASGLMDLDEASSCSSGPSVAVPETIPRPFVFTVTILDPDLAVSKETANFQVHIDRGRKKNGRMVKGQDWTVS